MQGFFPGRPFSILEANKQLFQLESRDVNEPELNITWDPAKAQSNIAKHRVTFAQAATVLTDPLALTVFDDHHSEVEERWFTLGMSNEGILLAVAHTFMAAGPVTVQVRIVSAREATRRERKQYENEQRQ